MGSVSILLKINKLYLVEPPLLLLLGPLITCCRDEALHVLAFGGVLDQVVQVRWLSLVGISLQEEGREVAHSVHECDIAILTDPNASFLVGMARPLPLLADLTERLLIRLLLKLHYLVNDRVVLHLCCLRVQILIIKRMLLGLCQIPQLPQGELPLDSRAEDKELVRNQNRQKEGKHRQEEEQL